MSFPLGSAGWVTRGSEYKGLYSSGIKHVGRYLLMFYQGSGTLPTRVGITVSGKVGGACVRNRTKRRLREALRLVLERDDPGAVMVFVATRRILSASFEEIRADIHSLMARGKKPR